MSTAHLPDVPTSTRLDITQHHETYFGAPLGEMQGGYPNVDPFSGSYPAPVFPPQHAPIPTFPPFVPDAYSANGVNYFPNYQPPRTMHPPVGFVPAMANPAPPMNHTYSQATSSYDLPVANATYTTTVLPSEVIGHHEVPFPFTFEHPFATQPEAPPVQGQQQVQYQVQDAQGDFFAIQPLPESGEVHNEDDRTYEEPRATLVEPETHLNNISSNSPAPNTAIYFRSDNPQSTCSEDEAALLKLAYEFIAKCPDPISVEEAKGYFIAAAAMESNDGQSTSQLSQTDTNDPPSLPHGFGGCEMASSGSSTVASTSTPAHSSPSGSSPTSPKQSEAASDTSKSTRTNGSSTGKRQRSEDNLEDRSKVQGREQCTGVQENFKEDGEPCKTKEGGEKRRKKRKPVNGQYICVICKILGQRCLPLSRRDALKRHIAKLHPLFRMLLLPAFSGFKVLEPRQIDEPEDLNALIVWCVATHIEARGRGVEIKAGQDLTVKYPDVARSLRPRPS